MKTVSLTDVRRRLSRIVQRFERAPSTIMAVSKRGKSVVVLLSMEGYEGLLETLDILGDRKLMASLRRSMRQMKAGKTISLEQVRKSLGLKEEVGARHPSR